MPVPCTVEAVEALMVVITYFGVSFVAAEGGHVNVPLMTQDFPYRYRMLWTGWPTYLAHSYSLFGRGLFGQGL